MRAASKFGLQKEALRTFLQYNSRLTSGSAKNLANAVWSDRQPKRELGNLARFLSHTIPYGIGAADFEEYLKSGDSGEGLSQYERFVTLIEGLYAIVRMHSEIPGLVVEFIALNSGKVGYYSFNDDKCNSLFEGKFNVGGRHIYFASCYDNPYSAIVGMAEIHGRQENWFPGMILGLDDYEQEMISCAILATKISNSISSHLDFHSHTPFHEERSSKSASRFLTGDYANTLREPYRFSSRMIRRSKNEI